MLSKTLERSLIRAIREAKNRHHEYVTLEHMLYGLLYDDLAAYIISECGGSTTSLKEMIEHFMTEEIPQIPSSPRREPVQTRAFKRVLQRAVAHVQSCGKSKVDSGDVLAALFEEKDSHAVYFLASEGLEKLPTVNFIAHELPAENLQKAPFPEEEDPATERNRHEMKREREKEEKTLEEFTINLTEQAAQGKLDPLIGRDEELQRIMQVLCRRKKNNPLLVGEPGVGKTSMAEGLALRIHDDRLARDLGKKPLVPDLLENMEVLMLDMGGLVAGTKYRGDFEKRLKSVVQSVQKRPNSVLFIDEMHTIVGAGATSGGSMDASNLLKPALQSGMLRVIGSTTYEEYKNQIEKDRALSRRFQKIDIEEPSVEDTINILKGLQPRYEKHHDITYAPDAVDAMAELANRYINERFLPDKAIDVMDEVGALFRLAGRNGATVKVPDVENVVSLIAHIPAKTTTGNEVRDLKNLEKRLKKVVFGQDKALDAVVTAVKRSRAGLGHPHAPTGSFLFAGPTGVGKTEVARQLAACLNVNFERFDMSEYMEKHAVARLIGSPPGYVGFEEGGQLTEAIRKHPYTVLLLDEIEKAHPDIFSILLQVMDNSTLTDNSGRKADFRNVILIMTSNAGARELTSTTIGFVSSSKGKDKTVINRLFAPEFRNRLDAIISFAPLDQKSTEKVVDKVILELEEQLAEKKVSIKLTVAARKSLAKRGYDPIFGARPLRRLIMKEIGDPLTEEILFGQLTHGGAVTVGDRKGKLTFTYSHELLEKKNRKLEKAVS